MKKNSFITFCCACVPGCGQMYLGFMRRGLSLATLFWGILAITFFIEALPILLFFWPVIWSFAFFDTFNLQSTVREGNPPEDAFLPGALFPQGYPSFNLSRRTIGWVLITVGALGVWSLFFRPMIDAFFSMLFPDRYYYHVIDGFMPAIISCIVIVLGVRMIRRPSAPPRQDEIKPFTLPLSPPPSFSAAVPSFPGQPEAASFEENPADMPEDEMLEDDMPKDDMPDDNSFAALPQEENDEEVPQP